MQYVCRRHFSEIDFTLVDETRLDRLAVPNLCTAVSHSTQFAHIEGFDDLGNHSMKTSIADQALFFMLYGLHTKWKQPVAYFLIHGSAKGEMLVNFSMEVLDATIQDQTFLPPCVTWLPTMPRP